MLLTHHANEQGHVAMHATARTRYVIVNNAWCSDGVLRKSNVTMPQQKRA